MENKKGSLSRVFLVISIILIVVLGVLLYMQKIKTNSSIAELKNNESELQEKIDSILNTTNDDITLNYDNTTLEKNDEEKVAEQEIKKVLTPSGFSGSSLIRVVLYSDDTVYVVNYDGAGYEENNIIKRILIAKDVDTIEYNGQEFKSIVVKGQELKIIETSFKWIEFNSEITKRLENNDVLSVTDAIKNNNGTYTLKGNIITVDTSREQIAEYPFYKETGEYKQITVSSDTKCIYSLDSYESKTDTVENVFSKKLYFGGCFNFTFENGKCTSVVEVVTGH